MSSSSAVSPIAASVAAARARRPCRFSRTSVPLLLPILSTNRSLTPSKADRVAKALCAAAVEDGIQTREDVVPTPKVLIDQDSDPDSTIVEITFGDRLGALIETMSALKMLGLNVARANVFLDSTGRHNKFAITKLSSGRKIDDPELLEAIRLTVINNILEQHPESSTQLAMGAAFGVDPPTEPVDVDIATHVNVYEDGPERRWISSWLGFEMVNPSLASVLATILHDLAELSTLSHLSLLVVETADRPGLLVDLVKNITDINISVASGEFDTEGLLAKAKFHVSYQGRSVIKPLQQVLANSLRYFLRRPSTEEASF